MPNAPKDAPVTPTHRMYALVDISSVEESDLGSISRTWIETGIGRDGRAESRVAQRLANTERDVRAAIVERLRALQARDETWSLELRMFIDELEAANAR